MPDKYRWDKTLYVLLFCVAIGIAATIVAIPLTLVRLPPAYLKSRKR